MILLLDVVCHLAQVYFSVKQDLTLPTWLFNNEVKGDGGWKSLPVKVLHPWQVPTGLRQSYHVVLWQCAPLKDLVPAALELGIYLNAQQLKDIQKDIKFHIPPPGKGSGKDGRLIKRDYADALIMHCFPDLTRTSEKYQAILQALLGRGWKHVNSRSAHSRDILQAFDGIDKEDQKEFLEINQVALDETLLNKLQASRAARTGTTPDIQKHYTPSILASLLPDSAGASLSRHPKLRRYQGFYMGPDGHWEWINVMLFLHSDSLTNETL